MNGLLGACTRTTPLVERLGSLSVMRMLFARVNLELSQHLSADLVLWQHPANRIANHLFRLTLHPVSNRLGTQTRIARVPGVTACVAFVTRVLKLLAIRQDDEIASVFVGGVSWLVLAHQDT